jgi:hypothetical protein
MIKYRYHLETDPEPGPHVKRLRSWSPSMGAGKFCSTWYRVPCRRGSWSVRYASMTRQDRRWARRDGQFYVTRSGRYRPKALRGYRMQRNLCENGHYHWTDRDKVRAWGPLRGDTLAVDADAMRRLHTRTKKRRGWR